LEQPRQHRTDYNHRMPLVRKTHSDVTILLRPGDLLWKLIHDPRHGGRVFMGEMTDRERLAYGLGRLSTALNIETTARILEEFEGTSLIALNKETICSALRSLLRSLKIDDDALDWYDALIEYASTIFSDGGGVFPHAGDEARLRSHDPASSTQQSGSEDMTNPSADALPSPTTEAT